MKSTTVRCGAFAAAAICLLAVGAVRAQAQRVTDFLDEFTGPTLSEGWVQFGDATKANFVGFAGDGYVIEYPVNNIPDTGLRRALDGSTNGVGAPVINSFTLDVSVRFNNYVGLNGFFKFRFFGGKFMEVVFSPSMDSIRVFSAEVGGNFGLQSGIGYRAGEKLNLRVTRDVTTGNVSVGYSVGDSPLQILGTASGLTEFTPETIDITFNRASGSPFPPFPAMVIDRYEQRGGIVPILFPSFTESFDGPTLDPSWNLIQSQAGDHVGFTGTGQYEITKSTTAGEAGLARDFGGAGSFNSSVAFQVRDFAGSASQVEFRSPTVAGGIIITLDSTGDIRVTSDGVTVAELTGFGYTDGESLEFLVTGDVSSGEAQVALRRNGGRILKLADLTGVPILATRQEIVLIKTAVGNGKSPRLLLDSYRLAEGRIVIEAEPFLEDFTGPSLDPAWFVTDTGPGSHIGFNDRGQYLISPQAVGVEAGLNQFLGVAGPVTLDLRARLNDFIGSGSEFRLQIPGPGGMSVALKSDGTLEVFSAELNNTLYSAPSGVNDGDWFELRVTFDPDTVDFDGVFEVGLGVNRAPLSFLVDGFNLLNLNPVQAQILIAKNTAGNGKSPTLVLDRFSIAPGFNEIPEVVEELSEDFQSAIDPGWTAAGLTHLGFNGEGQYVIRPDVDAPVTLTRLLAPNGTPGIPVGSFTLRLDAKFIDLAGTNGPPGSGTDFKLRTLGGALMEIVFNSFKTVRFFVGEPNGGNYFTGQLSEYEDGDTVNFTIAYDASGPSVTMSVGLNGEPPTFVATKSGLVNVKPVQVEIRGFRFNFDNPDITAHFLLDQLDIAPGLTAPGTLRIERAHNGLLKISWDNGVLQSAPALIGAPWTDVPDATSPYLQLPTGNRMYFRTKN